MGSKAAALSNADLFLCLSHHFGRGEENQQLAVMPCESVSRIRTEHTKK
jgi:hypothetical protein